MMKKCTKCGEIKSLSEFYRDRSAKDGRCFICKSCKKEYCKNRVIQLICQKEDCSANFTTNNSKAKYCPNCRTKKVRTKEEIKRDNQLESKVCTDCLQRRSFSEFPRHKTSPDGIRSVCRQCATRMRAERTHNLTCQNPECGVDFVSQCQNRKTCYECTPKFQFYSNEELKSEMIKHTGRNEFYKNSSRHYRQAMKRDWYEDFAQELWGDPIESGGYKKSDFIKACKRNNNGLGILYLIKCFGNGEWFYKVGITSLSLKKRYKHTGFGPSIEMPYCYKILWTIKGDAEKIYDLEKDYKRKVKDTKYQPEIKFGGSMLECFKCHGNCKILRKPDATLNLLL